MLLRTAIRLDLRRLTSVVVCSGTLGRRLVEEIIDTLARHHRSFDRQGPLHVRMWLGSRTRTVTTANEINFCTLSQQRVFETHLAHEADAAKASTAVHCDAIYCSRAAIDIC